MTSLDLKAVNNSNKLQYQQMYVFILTSQTMKLLSLINSLILSNIYEEAR